MKDSTSTPPIYVAKAELFRALAHPVRIRILELLVGENRTVSELAADVRLDASTLSQHLAVIRRNGLVSSVRRGNTVTYGLTDPIVADFLTTARAVVGLTVGKLHASLDALDDFTS